MEEWNDSPPRIVIGFRMFLPTADIVKLAQQGLGQLLRQVGKKLIKSVMEAEVEQLFVANSKNRTQNARLSVAELIGLLHHELATDYQPRVA